MPQCKAEKATKRHDPVIYLATVGEEKDTFSMEQVPFCAL